MDNKRKKPSKSFMLQARQVSYRRASLLLSRVVLLSVGFAVGIYVAHYRTLPYDSIVSGYRGLKSIFSCLRDSMPQVPFLVTCFRRVQDGDSLAGEILHTQFYPLEKEEVLLREFIGQGGAIASLDRDLLVVTPQGKIAVIEPDAKEEVYVAGSVSMGQSDWDTLTSRDLLNVVGTIRVAGIVLKERGLGKFDLFVAHHYFTGECIQFRLSSATLIRGGGINLLSPWRTLFDAEPCLASGLGRYLNLARAGGGMLIDGPHHLLLIIGDHGQDGWHTGPDIPVLPDDIESHLGKLVRIDLATGEAQILTVGHRNPQGMVRGKDGRVWATEHGPKGGDELNLLRPDSNYGWPSASYGIHRSDGDELDVQRIGRLGRVPRLIGEAEQMERIGRHDSFVRPIFAWVPSVATANLVFNDKRWFPLWRDDLLIVTLRGRSILRVRLHRDKVQYVERIHIGRERIRDIAFMSDGRMALLLERPPKVLFLSRSQKFCTEEFRQKRLVYALDCEAFGNDAAKTFSR